MLIDVWVYGTFSVARKNTFCLHVCTTLYVCMSLTFAEWCTDDGGSGYAVGKMVRQSVILNCRARVHGMRGRAGAISRSKRPMRSEA